MSSRLDVGAYVVPGAGATSVEGLDEALCRVVRVEGQLRDVRRLNSATGQLEGAEARFLASELRPARPAELRWHEALRLRSAIAAWRGAVADGDEDVDSLAALMEAAEQLADLVMDGDPTELAELAVCGYVSHLDGAQVVEINATESAGRVRVLIGEEVIFDGDPSAEGPPREREDGSVHGPVCRGSVDDVAARIDPTDARYAVARVCAALGREFDWSADTLDDVRDAVAPASPSGCPPFFDQDDEEETAMAFWRSVFGR